MLHYLTANTNLNQMRRKLAALLVRVMDSLHSGNPTVERTLSEGADSWEILYGATKGMTVLGRDSYRKALDGSSTSRTGSTYFKR